MDILTYRQLENLIKIAVRMPTLSIKQVAKETGLNLNSLYKWNSGQSGINPKRLDTILIWLMDCRPDVLEAAKTIFNNGGYRYER